MTIKQGIEQTLRSEIDPGITVERVPGKHHMAPKPGKKSMPHKKEGHDAH